MDAAQLAQLEQQLRSITPEQKAAWHRAIEAEYCRRHFYYFVRVAYKQAFGDDFIDGWHIAAICYHLQALWEGTLLTHEGKPTNKLLINAPPGCGKSRLTSVLMPAWIWARQPSAGLWFSSFGQALCDRDALATRQFISSDWYRDRFWTDPATGACAVHLMDDANQKRRYNTNKGGWRLSASIESRTGFGEHPEWLCIDDSANPDQAQSPVLRLVPIEAYDNIYSTRGIVRGVKFLISAQRLHAEDLPGYILAREFDRICWLMLPMEMELSRRCRTRLTYKDIDEPGGPNVKTEWQDPRETEGELLWPAGMNEEKVGIVKRQLKRAHAIAGQLQQRPHAPEGDLFLKEWFTVVDAAPKSGRAIRSWDKASSATRKADFTAGALLVDDGIDLYIADVKRFKCEMHERDKRMMETAEADGRRWPDYTVVLEQEGAGSGKDAAQLSAEKFHAAGFRVRIEKVRNKTKESRWEPFINLLSDGRVKLVKGDWNQAFIDECLAAPNGNNDDMLDAAAQGATKLAIGKNRGRIRRDLLGLTPEESDQLREQDAAAGKVLCENCVGLGCQVCKMTGFVSLAAQGSVQEVLAAIGSGDEELELGVRW